MSMNKVVGYGGFLSYGEIPYPSIKPGRKSNYNHNIWSEMNRTCDASSTANNFDRLKSEYIEKYSESVTPEDYLKTQQLKKGVGVKTNSTRLTVGDKDPELPQYEYKEPTGQEHEAQSLSKNATRDKNFHRAGSAVVGSTNKSNMKEAGNTNKGLTVRWQGSEENREGGSKESKEGEQSSAEEAQQDCPDILKDTFKVENQVYENVHFIPKLNPFNKKYDEFHEARKGFSNTIRPHSMYNTSQTDAPFARTENSQSKIAEMSLKNPYNVALKNGTEHWKTLYQTEMIHDERGLANRSEIPKWVRWDKAHQTGSLIQKTEYMFSYGDLGHNPKDIMNHTAVKLAEVDDPLKYGTTKVSNQVPGYTGHIPRAQNFTKSTLHGKGIHTRTTHEKQNITENYNKRVPGYMGHIPKSAYNDRGTLRQNCFSTEGETFC